MTLARMAWRNLWRNRRRTQLTVMAMVIATSLLIFLLTFDEGLLWDLVNNATETMTGHITVAAPGFLEDPAIENTLPESLPELNGNKIRTSCGRISCFALLSCGRGEQSQTQAAEILGIDPDAERLCSRLETGLASGTFLTSTRSHEIILGKGLALRLEATLGEEIVFMGQSADGGVAAELFRVAGIIGTGDTSRDARLALVGRASLQSLLGIEGRVHQFLLFLDSPLEAEKVARDLGSRVRDGPRLSFHPWQEQLPQMAMVFRIWGGVQMIATIIFYFAVILIALSTMFMAYRERMREFAILGAIGLTKVRLAMLILLEGFWLGGLSALLGGMGGLALCGLFHFWPLDLGAFATEISYVGTSWHPRIFCVPSAGSVLLPVGAMFLLGPLVSLLPAGTLYRQRPVEALRDS